jgi:DNA-binding PadR family transcriptional regulator
MFDKDRFFQGPWRASPFHRGNLKYVILDLIKDKPRHGYEIIRALEERSHGFYTPSPGAVYPTLQMLEEVGYANVIEQDGKKVYTITEEGNQFLAERKHLTDEVKSQMRHHWNPENIGVIGQTMVEFRKLGRLIGPRLPQVDPEKIRRIREVVSRAHQEIETILEE